MKLITRFKNEVGDGDYLWDRGWRVHLGRFWKFKFLVWSRD